MIIICCGTFSNDNPHMLLVVTCCILVFVIHNRAMLRNMVTSLIHHERIITTTPKAKELRRVADKMVTHAKVGSLHHRRLASGVVQERSAVVKLFEILGPRYQGRPGGYTRILKLARPRRGDSADMSVIEFVDREGR